MLAFPGMIARQAKEAGMRVPEDPDNEDWDPRQYPHFHVFCMMQLGKAMASWEEPEHNAKLIAGIPDEKIRKVSYVDLVNMGFQ